MALDDKMNKFDIELVNNPLSLRNSIVEKNDILVACTDLTQQADIIGNAAGAILRHFLCKSKSGDDRNDHRAALGVLKQIVAHGALDGAAQLYVGGGGVYLADCIELAAVYIPEGEGVEQIPERAYAKFLFQKLRPFGPDSRQIGYLFVQYVPAHTKTKVKNL